MRWKESLVKYQKVSKFYPIDCGCLLDPYKHGPVISVAPLGILGYFCIGFIDFMLKVKSLLDNTNLSTPNEYGKNDKIRLKYFQQPETKHFFYE